MASKKKNFKEEIIRAGEINLHTGIWEGKADTIICLHGLSGNLYSWNSLAPKLNSLGYNVIAYDLRGRGNSDKPQSGYGFENHLKDLNTIINFYKLENPILFGHSFGCMIAVRHAIEYPKMNKGIILMDGGGLLTIPQKLQILKVLKPSFDRLGKIYPSKESYLELLKNSPLIPNWSKTVEDYFLKELHEVNGGYICHMPPFVMEEELSELGGSIHTLGIVNKFFQNPLDAISKIAKNKKLDFEKITSPVLILRATEMNLFPNDCLLPVTSFNEMLRRIQNSRGIEIKTNHYGIIFSDNFDRDNSIEGFLKEISPVAKSSPKKGKNKERISIF